MGNDATIQNLRELNARAFKALKEVEHRLPIQVFQYLDSVQKLLEALDTRPPAPVYDLRPRPSND